MISDYSVEEEAAQAETPGLVLGVLCCLPEQAKHGSWFLDRKNQALCEVLGDLRGAFCKRRVRWIFSSLRVPERNRRPVSPAAG